ncbi:MAG: LuxR C-terminal-related transcriptional regulator [Prevotella sp.]|nr:LuxR C-terminal-related transcriptional regulator [Bacteroidales bacterium]MDD6745815.1 LuxR C-terminal-related transcriptional regulator [Bacteroidales bacterium]
MKKHKIYEADDRMISIIQDNYGILQCLGSFGINLGFGNKTVRELCEDQGVDTFTFLAVVNFTINGYLGPDDVGRLSIPTLMQYLRASHEYYLGFELPFIRKELCEAIDETDNMAKLIVRLYDEYAHSILLHMKYEEKTVFPYVESLLDGKTMDNYDIETFSKHHGQTDQKLRELKNIIIKYLPTDGLRNNQLSATLYDIYNCELWLAQHAEVEDHIFIPAIRNLEKKIHQDGITVKLSNMISRNMDNDALSEREKEVIVSLVQGMTNKEIADHLCISVNTVITHRKNIARKLQIHSPAGLTVYAIAKGLIDISSVNV